MIFKNAKRTNSTNFFSFFAKKFLAFAVVLFCVMGAFTIEYTWDGDAANNEWSSLSNWFILDGSNTKIDPTDLPDEDDDVFFWGKEAVRVIVDENVSINSLTTNTANGSNGELITFYITNGKTLFATTTNLGQTKDNNQNSGKVKIEGSGNFTTETLTANSKGGTLDVDENVNVVVTDSVSAGNTITVTSPNGGTITVPVGSTGIEGTDTVTNAYTWQGGNESEKWGAQSNWIPADAGYPGENDTVIFTGDSDITLKSDADLNIKNLIITGSAKVTLNIFNNKKFKVTESINTGNGSLSITGADGNNGKVDLNGVDITGTVDISGVTGATDINGTTGSGTIATSPINTWLGNSAVWNDATNWSSNAVPDEGDDVVIPTGCTNYPIISSAVDLGTGTVTLKDGATLTATAELTCASVTTTGAVTIGGIITTTGDQTYGGAVVLDDQTDLKTTDLNSTVIFNDTIDSNTNANYGLNITTTTIEFNGIIGGTEELYGLGAWANTIKINTNIISTQYMQVYQGSVTFSQAATLTTTETSDDSNANSNRIEFQNTVSSNYDITLSAGGGAHEIIFTDDVTGISPNTSVPNITISNAEKLTIKANLFATNLTLPNSATNLVFAPTLSTGQTIDVQAGAFSTITGTITKTENPTTFTNGFTQATGGGVVSLQGDITATNGNLSFTGATTLAGTTTLTATGTSGAITLPETTGAHDLTLDTISATLNGNISTNSLNIASTVATTMNFTNGITIEKLAVNVTDLTINGNGTLNVTEFAQVNGKTRTILVDGSTILNITNILRADNTGSGSLTFTKDSNSAINIPAGGALELEPGGETNVKFYDKGTVDKFIPGVVTGTTNPYAVESKQTSATTLDVTITVNGNATSDHLLNFDYYIDDVKKSEIIFTSNVTASVSSETLTISGLAAGQEVTIYTPCGSMPITTTPSYTMLTPTWTGETDTDWHKVANWTGISDLADLASLDIEIDPANLGTPANMPIISKTDATTVKSLTIKDGATVTVNTGANLTVTGKITIDDVTTKGILTGTGGSITTNSLEANGTVNLSGTAKLTFNKSGSTDASLTNNDTNNTYGNVIIDDTATDFDVATPLTATSFTTETNANITISGGSITTTGDQTYGGAVTLGANTTLSASDGNIGSDITFKGTVDSESGESNTLTITNATDVTFDGIIGSATPLGDVSITANSVAFNGGAGNGSNAGTGTVTLVGNGTDPNIAFGDSDSDTMIFGSLSFTNTPTVTLAGSLTTTSAIEFPNAVEFSVTSTINSNNNNIIFNGNLTGTGTNTNLTINANNKSIYFNNATPGPQVTTVGGHAILTANKSISFGNDANDSVSFGSFNITTNTLNLAGLVKTTNGGQVYNCDIILTADTEISASSSSGGADVTFGGTINSDTGNNWDLSIFGVPHATDPTQHENAGTVTFGGEVGTGTSFNPVGILDVKADDIAINGGTINTTGVQTYNGQTTIDTTEAVLNSSSGNISFTDAVTLNQKLTVQTVSDIEFISTINGDRDLVLEGATTGTSANKITFADKVGSTNNLTNLSANASTININGGTITTTGHQTYTGDVVLDQETTLTARGPGTGKLTITGKVTGGTLLNINTNSSEFSSTTTTTPIVFIGNSMDVNFGTHDVDVFIDLNNNATFTLTRNMSVKNLYFYNGTLDLAGNDIETTEDFAIFGSNYNADDGGWHNSQNTRFAYYHATPLVYYPNGSGTHNGTTNSIGTHTASFADLDGESITVDKNFYNNGADMTAIEKWTLNIPENGNPTANDTDTVTANQWGVPYAVAFNMTAQNSNATTGWVAAASGDFGQKVIDGTDNSNWQFESPQLTNVYVKTDRTLEFIFGMYNETTPTVSGTDGTNVEIYTDYTTLAEYNLTNPTTFSAISKTGNTITATANGTDNISGDSWNTDTIGTKSTTTTTGLNTQSTNSAGSKRTTTNNVDFKKGAFYHKNGNTMSIATSGTETYEDHCAPVLIATYTGQELHAEPGANPSTTQKEYDSHNFIEFVYSEEVSIPQPSGTGNISSSDVNIQSSNTLGNNTSPTGLSIAGLAEFTGGSLSTGSTDTSNQSVNALYRNFSLTAGGTEADQTHRVRLSIAGYVDGTTSLNGKTHHNWIGYINNANTPSGTVTPLSGVTDVSAKKNPIDKTITTTVNSAISNLYSPWDVSPPVFAKFATTQESWNQPSTQKEIISYSGNQFVETIDIHFFDNTPNYSSSENRWKSGGDFRTDGWYQNGTTFIPGSFIDTYGGSRFNTGANQTSGGIRSTSLIKVNEVLKIFYKNTSTEIPTDGFSQKVSNEIILGTSSSYGSETKRPGGLDTPYISLKLLNQDVSMKSDFEITYDENIDNPITDLAGNRMRTVNKKEAHSIFFPYLIFSLAPIGNDELFVLFSTKMDTDNLSEIPKNLKLSFTGTDPLQIDTTEPAKVLVDTDRATGFVVKLTRDVTYADIVKPSEGTGIETVLSPLSISGEAIKMTGSSLYARTTAFPLSTFAINAITPLYAYDNRPMNDGSGYFGTSPFDSEIPYVARLFDGSGSTGNTVLANEDIQLEYSVIPDGETTAIADDLTLYIGINPSANSISNEYNDITGEDSRVWLPEIVKIISNHANENNVETISKINNHSAPLDILVNSSYNWNAGDQFQFLFSIDGKTIDHDNDALTPPIPLFALNLKDPKNLASIDLWSLDIADIATQAGGVTILNNVINTNVNEKTRLEVDVKKAGNLTIQVMTIDGNIVKTLHRGRTSEGLHYYHWDGKNGAGDAVARGMYFIRVVGPGIDETRKVMAVKD